VSIEIIFAALWLGFLAAGMTVLIRVLPVISGFVERGIKPWACDKCMSFWLILFVTACVPALANDVMGYRLIHGDFVLAAPAAYALSLFMLRLLTEPMGPPPSFEALPELIESVPPVDGKRYIVPPFSDPPPNH
jgi:hypothetical protein